MVTDVLPEPPESSTEEQRAAFTEMRDAAVARGPVTLTFPDEAVGTVHVLNQFTQSRRELEAAGTVEIGTFESAMATFTTFDPVWFDGAPMGTFVSLDVAGVDDAGLDAIMGCCEGRFVLRDADLTDAGLAMLRNGNVHGLVLSSGAATDAGLEALLATDAMMVDLTLPGITGAGISSFLAASSAQYATFRGLTADQIAGLTEVRGSGAIELRAEVAADVTASDAAALVAKVGAACKSVFITSGEGTGEPVLRTEDAYRLQLAFPELTLNGKWFSGKALRKLAAKEGIDLEA